MTDGSGGIRRTRKMGLVLAGGTAFISGWAVFLNSYGVTSFGDPTLYTTLKNASAALILAVVALTLVARRSGEAPSMPVGTRQRVSLVVIAVIGGSVPFVLFFEGLARASSTSAAFIHKTLIVWVAAIAVPFLKEKLGWRHLTAIGLVVGGQAALQGGVAGLSIGTGEVLIALATLLWAIEVVVAKKLLSHVPAMTVGLARMVGGSVLLLTYVTLSGKLSGLGSVGAEGWGWVLLTGALLAGYVATWYLALARAQAVDVTALLILAAVMTAALDSAVKDATAPDPLLGGLLIVVGAGIVMFGRRSEVATA